MTALIAHQGQKLRRTMNSPYFRRSVNSSAGNTSAESATVGQRASSHLGSVPSTAITILSGSSPRDIAALIAREDVPGLTRIKGIGKKTAELLVVELREKCEQLVLSWTADGNLRAVATHAGAGKPKPTRHPMLTEVMSALVGMGWKPMEAEQACSELVIDEQATIESLLRHALRSMPR